MTRSLDELRELLAGAERRVVLLGGDGALHAAASLRGPKPELALLRACRRTLVRRRVLRCAGWPVRST